MGWGGPSEPPPPAITRVKTCATFFDETRILKGRNELVNYDILGVLRNDGQLINSVFAVYSPFLGQFML